jgi:hypothetical protein
VEDGIIKIEFVKSNDNDSDIFPKNANQEMYKRHVKKFLGDMGVECGIWTFRYRKGIENIPYVHSPLDTILNVRTVMKTTLF